MDNDEQGNTYSPQSPQNNLGDNQGTSQQPFSSPQNNTDTTNGVSQQPYDVPQNSDQDAAHQPFTHQQNDQQVTSEPQHAPFSHEPIPDVALPIEPAAPAPIDPQYMFQPSVPASPINQNDIAAPANIDSQAFTPSTLNAPTPTESAPSALPGSVVTFDAAPSSPIAAPQTVSTFIPRTYQNPVGASTPTPAPVAPAQNAAQNPLQSPVQAKVSKKKLLALPLMIILLVLVIGGGGAAAYFGIIVPNKPENKLRAAFSNLIQQKQLSAKGSIAYTDKTSGFTLDYNADTNLESNQLGLSGTLGIDGMSFPYDVRYIDKNVYLKAGGLDGIAKVVGSADPAYAAALSKLNDQWYVIDKSFWQSMGSETSCATDLNFTLTDADVKIIENSYSKHPLFGIKSASSATVDGTPVTKYELNPASDAEFNAFTSGLNDISIVKKARDCAKSTGVDNTIDQEIKPITNNKDTSTGAMFVYIDGKKQLKKIELEAKQDTGSVKISSTFTYRKVSVQKPEGAKPAQDILGDLFGGTSGVTNIGGTLSTPGVNVPTGTPSPNASVSAAAADSERQSDINSLHARVEAYYAENNSYPSFSDMNNNSFIQSNMSGVDMSIFKDPSGTGTLLVASPQKNAYAYQPTPLNCTSSTCTSYTLTATLSDGSTYVKTAFNN
ncbi:MAG: hypothetical protein ABI303_03600 [Candidatus Saccharimonas sp.]